MCGQRQSWSCSGNSEICPELKVKDVSAVMCGARDILYEAKETQLAGRSGGLEGFGFGCP